MNDRVELDRHETLIMRLQKQINDLARRCDQLEQATLELASSEGPGSLPSPSEDGSRLSA